MNIYNGIYGYLDKKKNQIVYIGQSNDIFRRHSHHMNPSKYNEQVINRIIQNNPDRYELVIIKARQGFSKGDRDILERHYIELYNTFADKDKFNYTPGGDFVPSTIPEVKKKLSKAKSGSNNPMYGKVGEKHPMYGKHHTKEAQKKISLHQNTTGYFRVSLVSCHTCKSGKRYLYTYYNENKKRKKISSINLEKLKQKVLDKGLTWEKIN